MRLAIFSPLPPAWSGIADYTARLLPHLAERWDVVAFIPNDDPEPVPLPAEVRRSRDWQGYASTGGVDRVLLCLGNSIYHLDVPDLARDYGGVVLAHDVRLTALHCLRAAREPDPHFLSKLVEQRHGRHLGAEIHQLEDTSWVSRSIAPVRARLDQANAYLLAPSVGGAGAVAVHSPHAARLATLDLINDPVPVLVVPFGHPPIHPPTERRDRATLASFGLTDTAKAPDLLIEAFAEVVRSVPSARLRFVGPQPGSDQMDRLHNLIATMRIGDAVTFTDRLDDDAYRRELERATVAVQLRRVSNGESSAAVADCQAAGIPTVVTDVGAQADLPDSSVLKIGFEVDPQALGRDLVGILNDPARQAELARTGCEHAAANSFGRAADALGDLLEATPPRPTATGPAGGY